MPRDSLNFPENFIWGTSTAGHQVEGGNAFSDWWAWEQKGLIEDGTVSGRAMDYWNRHEADHALMAICEVRRRGAGYFSRFLGNDERTHDTGDPG